MKKTKLVQGFGVNDANYNVTIDGLVNGKRRKVWECQIYKAWKNMLQRCYSAESIARFPTYAGCSVDPEWRYFMSFRSWMQNQDWKGKQLDKDILYPGNKIYAPDKCVFLPSALNKFLLERLAGRGDWPIGVSWDKKSGKFRSQCRNPSGGKKVWLGLFEDPLEAHEAWRERKHELACIYADQQTDPRIAEALRTRYAKKETV